MREIDFTKLSVEVRIGEFQVTDLSKEVGNALFQTATTIEQDSLAREIHAGKPIVIPGKLYAEIKERLSGVLFHRVIAAIERSAVEVKENKELNTK